MYRKKWREQIRRSVMFDVEVIAQSIKKKTRDVCEKQLEQMVSIFQGRFF